MITTKIETRMELGTAADGIEFARNRFDLSADDIALIELLVDEIDVASAYTLTKGENYVGFVTTGGTTALYVNKGYVTVSETVRAFDAAIEFEGKQTSPHIIKGWDVFLSQWNDTPVHRTDGVVKARVAQEERLAPVCTACWLHHAGECM